MVRHTSTVVAVPSQADNTQLSPMGVAWSTNALKACSLRMGSQDSPRSHGPIVLCCPGNGREAPMPNLFAHRLRSPTWSHVCAGPLISYFFFKILGFLEPSRRPPGGGTGQLEFHSEGSRGPVPATRPGPGSGTRRHGASLSVRRPAGQARAGPGREIPRAQAAPPREREVP